MLTMRFSFFVYLNNNVGISSALEINHIFFGGVEQKEEGSGYDDENEGTWLRKRKRDLGTILSKYNPKQS